VTKSARLGCGTPEEPDAIEKRFFRPISKAKFARLKKTLDKLLAATPGA
jgi:hypothetical protein